MKLSCSDECSPDFLMVRIAMAPLRTPDYRKVDMERGLADIQFGGLRRCIQGAALRPKINY